MKNILTLSSIIYLFSACMPESQNQQLTYQNIVIFSDLSSRITNKPNKDTGEIRKLLEYFKEECVKPGKKIGDKSSIYFSTFSSNVKATIDLEQIKDLGDKQKFINSTGKFKNSGLTYQIEEFDKKVKNTYASIRNDGLDLISILIEKIENEPLIKKDTFTIDGIDTTFIDYDNHFYIFTDGYLEYRNNSNSQFYFGSSQIGQVRSYCIKNNVNILNSLANNPSFCLPPMKRKNNGLINLHVLETHERGFNDKLLKFSLPAGQRDNEILEAVWNKWAKESGFKSFEWKKY